LHGFPVWHWSALTVPAVAARAGVTERTVYRHFTSERGLRDAVMEYLQRDANVAMDNLQLEDVADLARRILEYTAGYPLVPRTPQDPTVSAATARTRRKLIEVLEPHTEGWAPLDRTIAAAIIDVLWGSASLERLVGEWELSPADAIRGTAWAIRLVEAAIRAGHPPE
jgi:AcrR family transcriptional regulator